MPNRQQQETHLDEDQRASGGGLRYQQAFRDPEARVGVTPAAVGQPEAPDQQQRAREYGGPDLVDEAVLHEQGYPKLGSGMHSRVTQVEHGPYAGGTQQGEPEVDDQSAEDKAIR